MAKVKKRSTGRVENGTERGMYVSLHFLFLSTDTKLLFLA